MPCVPADPVVSGVETEVEEKKVGVLGVNRLDISNEEEVEEGAGRFDWSFSFFSSSSLAPDDADASMAASKKGGSSSR